MKLAAFVITLLMTLPAIAGEPTSKPAARPHTPPGGCMQHDVHAVSAQPRSLEVAWRPQRSEHDLERAEHLGPPILKVDFPLQSALQQSLDPLLRFRPR